MLNRDSGMIVLLFFRMIAFLTRRRVDRPRIGLGLDQVPRIGDNSIADRRERLAGPARIVSIDLHARLA